MAQLFTPSINIASRLFFVGGALLVALITLGWTTAMRSSLVSRVGYVRTQPVAFSHRTHVGTLAMDCRYCHSTVETSASAGLPSTKTCMGCHGTVLASSPALAMVRASYAEDRSIPWIRVHDLPDFVRFDHSIHVAKGVGCTTCHGPIGEMPRTVKGSTLDMAWCLACHRHPEGSVRPLERVFDPAWIEPADQLVRGRELMRSLAIDPAPLEDCSLCHQ